MISPEHACSTSHRRVASNTGLYGNLMTALGASTRIFQLVDRQPAMGGVVVNLDVSPAGDMQVPVPPARRAEPRSRGLIHFKVRESRLSSAPLSPAHSHVCAPRTCRSRTQLGRMSKS